MHERWQAVPFILMCGIADSRRKIVKTLLAILAALRIIRAGVWVVIVVGLRLHELLRVAFVGGYEAGDFRRHGWWRGRCQQ